MKNSKFKYSRENSRKKLQKKLQKNSTQPIFKNEEYTPRNKQARFQNKRIYSHHFKVNHESKSNAQQLHENKSKDLSEDLRIQNIIITNSKSQKSKKSNSKIVFETANHSQLSFGDKSITNKHNCDNNKSDKKHASVSYGKVNAFQHTPQTSKRRLNKASSVKLFQQKSNKNSPTRSSQKKTENNRNSKSSKGLNVYCRRKKLKSNASSRATSRSTNSYSQLSKDRHLSSKDRLKRKSKPSRYQFKIKGSGCSIQDSRPESLKSENSNDYDIPFAVSNMTPRSNKSAKQSKVVCFKERLERLKGQRKKLTPFIQQSSNYSGNSQNEQRRRIPNITALIVETGNSPQKPPQSLKYLKRKKSVKFDQNIKLQSSPKNISQQKGSLSVGNFASYVTSFSILASENKNLNIDNSHFEAQSEIDNHAQNFDSGTNPSQSKPQNTFFPTSERRKQSSKDIQKKSYNKYKVHDKVVSDKFSSIIRQSESEAVNKFTKQTSNPQIFKYDKKETYETEDIDVRKQRFKQQFSPPHKSESRLKDVIPSFKGNADLNDSGFGRAITKMMATRTQIIQKANMYLPEGSIDQLLDEVRYCYRRNKKVSLKDLRKINSEIFDKFNYNQRIHIPLLYKLIDVELALISKSMSTS